MPAVEGRRALPRALHYAARSAASSRLIVAGLAFASRRRLLPWHHRAIGHDAQPRVPGPDPGERAISARRLRARGWAREGVRLRAHGRRHRPRGAASSSPCSARAARGRPRS
jgi:hypothetical protein